MLLGDSFYSQVNHNFYLFTNQIFKPGVDAVIYLQGSNLKGIALFRVYKITDPINFLSKYYLPEGHIYFQPRYSNIDWGNVLKNYQILKEWRENLYFDQDQWITKEIKTGLNKSGVYIIEANYNSSYTHTLVLISPYAVISKISSNELLNYFVDRISNLPLKDLNVYVFEKGVRIALGKTEQNGLYYVKLPPMKAEESQIEHEEFRRRPVPWTGRNLLVIGEKNGNIILANPYTYWFGARKQYEIYLFTDRPIYRPAQLVNFKGIVRKRDKTDNLQVVLQKKVSVNIRDSRGENIWSDTLRTNENGTFLGKFYLPIDAPLGMYQLTCDIDGYSISEFFDVQEYKKSDFKLEITTDRKIYTRGQIVDAQISAEYYFGEPVINADVEYQISRKPIYVPHSTSYDLHPGASYKYIPLEENIIHTGSGKLDNLGKLNIKYQTDAEINADFIYRLEAKITDISRQTITGSEEFKVVRALFSLSLKTDKYVYVPGEKCNVEVETKDHNDIGVVQPYKVVLMRNWWIETPKIQDDKKFFERKQNTEIVNELDRITNLDGKDKFSFDLTFPGSYTIKVTTSDSMGNETKESVQIYCTQKNIFWWSDAVTSIQIVTDRNSYKTCDTVHALIIMPIPDASVLITKEAENIIDYHLMKFNGFSQMIDIPLNNIHSPNFYLNISSLYNDNFYQQSKNIVVEPVEKFLNIKVTTDKSYYKPSESGTVTLEVFDNLNNPVKNTELSLAIVDESIYPLVSEKIDEIKQIFYPQKNQLVRTYSSFNFAFSGYSQPDLMMRTGSIEKGIDKKKSHFVKPVIRKDFKDIMIWEPLILTDENGKAILQVKYPDNLTTWRATAIGITKDTKVGEKFERVVVKKNLMVKIEAPQFITQRDTTTISVIIYNYLNNEKMTKVLLKVSVGKLIGKEKNIYIKAKEKAKVEWKFTTLKTDTVILTAQALTDEESDGEQISLPVVPHGILISNSQSVKLQDEKEAKEFTVKIPTEADLSSAQIKIHLAPSIASTILTTLDDLVGYPYGCVEQTMSRFLPTIVVANVLKDFNAPIAAQKKNELPEMVQIGLKRIYTFQHLDGGWGWWQHDNTDPFMTSYVIYGFLLTKMAGFSVDDLVLTRGISRLKEFLISGKLDPTTRAFILYVLIFANKQGIEIDKNFLKTNLKGIDIQNSNNYTRALYCISNSYLNELSNVKSTLELLNREAIQTSTFSYWSSKSWQYNWQDDNVETTAFVLKALLETKSDSDLIQKVVQYLINQRQGSSWMSTKQTAIVLLTLADYLRYSKELDPDYDVNVYVNGKKIFSKHINKEDVFNKEISIEILNEKIKIGNNNIKLEKSGKGKLYSTVITNYYTKEENIQKSGRKFIVQREYYKLKKEYRDKEYIFITEPIFYSINSGDEIFVNISIKSDKHYEYFMIEDPIPSGCEVVLNYEKYKIKFLGTKEEFVNFGNMTKEFKIAKTAFFLRNINAGITTISYVLRTKIPGYYHVMPASGYLMYYPEVRGNSSEMQIRIQE